MTYRPRIDCSDVPLDSDDRWLTVADLRRRVAEVLATHEHTTAGVAEAPLSLTSAQIRGRLEHWAPRLRRLGRGHTVGDEVLYHWSVAELIAHEALYEWWSNIVEWPLGWWPWAERESAVSIPGPVAMPQLPPTSG